MISSVVEKECPFFVLFYMHYLVVNFVFEIYLQHKRFRFERITLNTPLECRIVIHQMSEK